MDRDELGAWLRLGATPGLGRDAARRLLAAFGLPQAVLHASPAAVGQVVGPAQQAALRQPPEGFDALLDATWDWLQAAPGAAGQARAFVPLGDARYPAALLAQEDPPLALYLAGRLDLWSKWLASRAGPARAAIETGASQDAPPAALAVVGTRNATPQGLQNAHAFARHFAAAGLPVVSGLALGIDAAAHAGALEGAPAGQLATVAFVGTGLDRVYPRQHRELAHRIAAQGVIAGEYPLGMPPLAQNFPRRNRLIAGLALGTLVVEAAQPSGSLVTARLAAEQGREVFAIPGSIHSPQSRGCHALIRQGAKLVESAQDVLEELRLPAAATSAPAPAAAPLPGEGDSSGDALLQALGYGPVGLDALVARTGRDAADLQAALLALELEGAVGRLPGGLFQRLARA